MTNRTNTGMGLLDQVDYHLTHPLKLDSRAKHFYPTQASCLDAKGKVQGACLRANAFSFWGVKETNPPSAETMWIFAFGKYIESMMTEWFKQMGIYAGNAIKFFNAELFLSGELDGVNKESPSSPKLYGWENKTSHGAYFVTEQITGRPGKPPKPKSDHIMQVMCYLDNFTELDYFILTYIDRDTMAKAEYKIELAVEGGDTFPKITRSNHEFYIDYDISLASMYDRYIELAKYIKKDVLPPVDYRPIMTQKEMDKALENGEIYKTQYKKYTEGKILTGDWRCRYCNHRSLCRTLDRKKIKDFRERYEAGEFTAAAIGEPGATDID